MLEEERYWFFIERRKTIEKLAVARCDVGENITSAWDKEKQPNQWARLVEIINERNPEKIGINVSPTFGIADELVQTDYHELKGALPHKHRDRYSNACPCLNKYGCSWLL